MREGVQGVVTLDTKVGGACYILGLQGMLVVQL